MGPGLARERDYCAVVDSGVKNSHPDLKVNDTKTWVLQQVKFNSFTNSLSDGYSHSIHVAGIIGGNGSASTGAYIGIAPKVNLIQCQGE